MSLPTPRESAIEALYQDALVTLGDMSKGTYLTMIRSTPQMRKSFDTTVALLAKAIEADRLFRISDAIMGEAKKP
jgi:hypothetical protein